MAALKKLEVKISKQAKTVTAIADMDLTRSRIMAKLHRDTDPLKRGTSQLLKMSPTVLKSIKSNLADKKHGADAGKGQKHIAPAPARGQMQGRGHPSGVADEEEEEEEEARMKRFVDVDSLVTPRRNVRRWERELVGLIKDKKKREEVASGAKTERRMQAFKPPSKEEMKRLSKQATVDLGYSSNEDEEGEEAASAGLGMSRRRKSHGRRRSSVSIVLEDEGEDACQGKGGGGAAGRVDKGEGSPFRTI